MGLLDSLKNFPFSLRGDYEEFYKNAHSTPKERQNEPTDSCAGSKTVQHISDLQKYRIILQQYSERLKNREAQIETHERASLDKIKSASNSAHEYSKALLDTEYRVIDYAKRFDAKESSIFAEIQKDAEKFKAHNSTPAHDGFEFENEFSKVLAANGFKKVAVTPKSGDYGGDITAEKEGVKYVVQCKYYTSMVGIDAVQQVCGAKIHYGAHVGVVASNSVFTHAAKILAEEAGIFLWDCEIIESMKKSV